MILRRDAGIFTLEAEDLRRIMRTKPVVGVIGNASRVENRFQVQMVGERNLRDQMHLSVLCDAKTFTAGLESVYREIWQRWCERQGKK